MAAGTPGARLMQAAGTRAAELLLREGGDRLRAGVTCWVGPGNNGGDAYVVAAHLARHGVAVCVRAVAPPRTDDARAAAAAWAQAAGLAVEEAVTAPVGAGVVVDGLLGTGHAGPLRGAVQDACAQLAQARDAGGWVVALDLPTGLDATTGALAEGHVRADDTISFGTCKRGALLARDAVGRLRVVDIGLGPHAVLADGAWRLASPETLGGALPVIPWDAHKGRRGRVAVVGGALGMAGAVVLACEGALRAGAGLVTAVVPTPSVPVVQGAQPQALATAWPSATGEGFPSPLDALAVGPGLGRGPEAAALMAWLQEARAKALSGVPVVLDADALWHLAHGARSSEEAVAAWGRAGAPVVITPHPGECARLLGHPLPEEAEARAEAVRAFARASGAVVVLKGTPTLIATPDDAPPWVMPRGTAVLATGGSGDLLTGLVVTLLAQRVPPALAAALAATAHGLAAEQVQVQLGGVRGATLQQVSAALPRAWRELERPPVHPEGILLDLPAVT